MCTAATYKTKDFYFGRTLDYNFSYAEEITITPRNFPFLFRNGKTLNYHNAIIGMAYVADNYPLYYDAINEKGLCIAGLNFVGNAHYHENVPGKNNIASFEFIPWILTQCSTVKEAKELIEKTNITNESFNDELPPAELHWIIADKHESITVESVYSEIRVYPNPVGILTNNPSFENQMFNLNNYMHLSPNPPQNLFSDKLSLHPYSRGMGSLGLPGDLSSQSRFVRATFTKMNSVSGDSEEESISQFFHILGTVEQSRGCCAIENGNYEITIYTSCCNADKGIYYYTTYNNRQINAVDMHKENLDYTELIQYPLITTNQILRQN